MCVKNRKQVFTNISSNLFAFFTTVVVTFIFTPYFIAEVGKEGYSFFSISNSFVTFFTIIPLSISTIVARYSIIEIGRGRVHLARRYLSTGLAISISIVFFSSLLMVIGILNIEFFLDIPETITLDVKILFSCVFGSILVSIASSTHGICILASNRLEHKAIGDLLRSMLRIVLFLILIISLGPELYILGVVPLITSIFVFYYQKFICRKIIPEFYARLILFDIELAKSIIKSSSWYGVNIIGTTLFLGFIVLLTNNYIGVSQGGEVAVALIVPSLFSTIIVLISSLLQPRLTKVYGSSSNNKFISDILFSQKLSSMLITVPIISIIVFSREILSLWLPYDSSMSTPVLMVIFLIPVLLQANVIIISNVNVIINKVKEPACGVFFTGTFSIVSSLIYLYAEGDNILVMPIIASCCSLLYNFFYVPLFTSKSLMVSHKIFYITISKTLIFSFVFYVFSIILKANIAHDTWFDLFICLSLLSIIGFITHFLLLFYGEYKTICKKLI